MTEHERHGHHHHNCYREPPCPPQPCRPFFLECVIVCRDYDDFLRHTLPTNKQLFDNMVVVTSTLDKRTQKLCEFYHVDCVWSKELADDDFKKGSAINCGLARLSKRDWVLHLDADVWLPPQTRILLERGNLDKRMLYGCDRFIVKGPQTWDDFMAKPKLQHEDSAFIHPTAFPVGARVMTADTGYIPIGFFQLWHPEVSGIAEYPSQSNHAGRTDMIFAKMWDRSQRSFIPEVIAYHLESENAAMGANWHGRETGPFKIGAEVEE